jgi:multiple sugar transport system substrate-binding protein
MRADYEDWKRLKCEMSFPDTSRRTFPSRLNEMVEQLRGEIAHGKYKPGAFLPPEKTLAKQFRLSNKSVRKGLEMLLEEGLIEKIPRVGSKVKAKKTAERNVTVLRLGCRPKDDRDFGLNLLLDDFRQQYPSIRIEKIYLQHPPGNTETMKTYLHSGLVDAFTTSYWNLRIMAEAGLIGELEPMAPNERLYGFLNEAFTFDNVLYAHPLAFAPLVLAYNVKHFRDCGIAEPDAGWSWEEAIRQAERLSAPPHRHGLHFQPFHDERWPVFLLQSETGDDKDGGRKGNRPDATKWMDGIRLSKNIIRNHTIFPNYLLESEKDIGTLFLQGKTSMIVTSYFSLNRFIDSDLEYDISSLPYLREPRTLLLITGIAINRQSAHKAAAHCLADYLTSPQAQRIIRRHSLGIPSEKPAAEDRSEPAATIRRPSRYELYRDIIPSYRRLCDLGLSAESFFSLREWMKYYWADLIDESGMKEALRNIAVRQASGAEESPVAL